MSHYAQIDTDGTVLQVLVVDNSIADGHKFLSETLGLGGTWVQTSYNTHAGVHHSDGTRTPDGGTPLRKNYASIGHRYDSTRDAFIPPKPHPSWILNETTCHWDPPVPRPADGKIYRWNESTQSWDLKL